MTEDCDSQRPNKKHFHFFPKHSYYSWAEHVLEKGAILMSILKEEGEGVLN